jgi:hypothetical protein
LFCAGFPSKKKTIETSTQGLRSMYVYNGELIPMRMVKTRIKTIKNRKGRMRSIVKYIT